jgi:hypothetical protein
MNDRMDNALRETFDEIAGGEPMPGGLARAALRRARRQRLGRAGLIGGAAVACAATVAAVAAAVPGNRPPEVTATVQDRTIVAFGGLRDPIVPSSPTGQTVPLELPSAGAPKGSRSGVSQYSLLLDPATGQYERLPYNNVRPSPDGSRALVWKQEPFAVGVWERRTGNVRWFPATNYGASGDWSPDGRRILFSEMGGPTIVLADPETMATTKVELRDWATGTDCIFIEMVWAADSKRIAESVYCKDGGDRRVSRIQFYNLSGEPTGSIPATAALAGRVGCSPDGALLLLTEKSGAGLVIVDAATGTERSRLSLSLAAATPEGQGVIGWYDAQHLAVYSTSGENGDNPRASLLVVDLSGATVSTTTVPYHLGGEKVLGTVRR